jgi:3alpha(or 20beta)-hydroxysteroid dehydrogenase
MFRLDGKTVVVTGGARGVGAADVLAFCRAGASVAIADVIEAEGIALAERLQAEGHAVRFYCHDVTDEKSWERLAIDVKDWTGSITTLVNNAGIVNRTGINGTALRDWNRVMSVNLTGAFLGLKHICPSIRDVGGGAVVNMSSVAAHVGHNDPAYAASKAALLGLTRTAAAEYVDWNIRVNAICPAVIVTDLNRGGAHLEPWRRATPQGRFGKAEEVAALIAFLVSDSARFITGEDIAIDGGFLAAGAARRISIESGIDLTAAEPVQRV